MGNTSVRAALAGLALSLVTAGSAAAAPSITSFTPASGTIANQVILNGSGFTGATAVKFNGVVATYTVNSDIKITATVPNGASTGPLSVTAGGSTASSAASFTVTPGMALSNNGGPPTTAITVYGAGFRAASAVDLYFDNLNVALFVSGPTGTISATYQVPVSAQPGQHWITFVERSTSSAAQKIFTVRTNWAQEGFGPTGRGLNPFENTINTSNAATMTAAWSGDAGGFANHSPFVVGAFGIFVADVLGNLHAYSSTGALLWTASPGADMENVQPVVANGNVYIGDGAGNVRAYSQTCRSDGGVCSPLWTTNVATSVTSGLTFYNGTIYAPTSDGSIHTLNPATGVQGTPIFGFDTAHGSITTPVSFDVDGSFYYGTGAVLQYRHASSWGTVTYPGTISPVAVNNGSAYFTTTDGMLHRFGSGGWDVATSAGGCAPAPVIANGYVYAAGCTNLAAYIPKTGAIYWSATTGNIQGISEANGVIYVCEGPYYGALIQAYYASYGGYLWSGGGCTSAPEVANGNVFAAYGNFTAYNFPIAVGNLRKAPAIPSLRPDYTLKPQLSGTIVLSSSPLTPSPE